MHAGLRHLPTASLHLLPIALLVCCLLHAEICSGSITPDLSGTPNPPSSPEIVSVVNGENRTVVRFELRPGKDNGVRVTAYSVECKSTPRAVYIKDPQKANTLDNSRRALTNLTIFGLQYGIRYTCEVCAWSFKAKSKPTSYAPILLTYPPNPPVIMTLTKNGSTAVFGLQPGRDNGAQLTAFGVVCTAPCHLSLPTIKTVQQVTPSAIREVITYHKVAGFMLGVLYTCEARALSFKEQSMPTTHEPFRLPYNTKCPGTMTCAGAGLTTCAKVGSTCVDVGSDFACLCANGFTGDGFTCQDIDECSSDENICLRRNETCINRQGGYVCSSVVTVIKEIQPPASHKRKYFGQERNARKPSLIWFYVAIAAFGFLVLVLFLAILGLRKRVKAKRVEKQNASSLVGPAESQRMHPGISQSSVVASYDPSLSGKAGGEIEPVSLLQVADYATTSNRGLRNGQPEKSQLRDSGSYVSFRKTKQQDRYTMPERGCSPQDGSSTAGTYPTSPIDFCLSNVLLGYEWHSEPLKKRSSRATSSCNGKAKSNFAMGPVGDYQSAGTILYGDICDEVHVASNKVSVNGHARADDGVYSEYFPPPGELSRAGRPHLECIYELTDDENANFEKDILREAAERITESSCLSSSSTTDSSQPVVEEVYEDENPLRIRSSWLDISESDVLYAGGKVIATEKAIKAAGIRAGTKGTATKNDDLMPRKQVENASGVYVQNNLDPKAFHDSSSFYGFVGMETSEGEQSSSTVRRIRLVQSKDGSIVARAVSGKVTPLASYPVESNGDGEDVFLADNGIPVSAAVFGTSFVKDQAIVVSLHGSKYFLINRRNGEVLSTINSKEAVYGVPESARMTVLKNEAGHQAFRSTDNLLVPLCVFDSLAAAEAYEEGRYDVVSGGDGTYALVDNYEMDVVARVVCKAAPKAQDAVHHHQERLRATIRVSDSYGYHTDNTYVERLLMLEDIPDEVYYMCTADEIASLAQFARLKIVKPLHDIDEDPYMMVTPRDVAQPQRASVRNGRSMSEAMAEEVVSLEGELHEEEYADMGILGATYKY